MKPKVALALAFASSAFSSLEQAVAAPTEGKQSLPIAHSAFNVAPSTSLKSPSQKARGNANRAYYMLKRADYYLKDDNRSQVEQSCRIDSSDPGGIRFDMHTEVTQWARALTDKEELAKRASNLTKSEFARESIASVKNTDIAIKTVKDALIQLNGVDDEHQKLDLYYISSIILRKAGDEQDAKKCEQLIEQYIRSYETTNNGVNEEQIESAITVLGAQSYAILAVDIPDIKPDRLFDFRDLFGMPEKDFPQSKIIEAESLRLRIISLADKLKPTTQTRRMAHRNLSLWYKLVGKNSEAESQKQILFTLIGKHGDNYLYPTSGGCGHLLWWTEPSRDRFYCGMG